ncbi:hypothetical protein BKA66DRAFT_466279 [Pyrenochaeta sp. MPI-SDFR-AT-0127]|nr:hypothetical protein BKA66DRAFT_466279 [Pyrenochaeta sp. MPI-SDFR-AT-0127]
MNPRVECRGTVRVIFGNVIPVLWDPMPKWRHCRHVGNKRRQKGLSCCNRESTVQTSSHTTKHTQHYSFFLTVSKMKAFTPLVVLALATFGMGAAVERRQTWGPWTCPTKQQCEATCIAAGLVYSAHDCNNAWTNCACNYAK